MATEGQGLYQINTGILPKDACIVIVQTLWNPEIVSELAEGCVATLREYGFHNIKIVQVPGAFEIPFGVKSYWQNHADKFEKPQAFITLGCVLRGETPHFDYISKAVTDGVMMLNMSLPVPTVFGVLTVDTKEQALDRIGGNHGHKGREAALTALKMMMLKYE